MTTFLLISTFALWLLVLSLGFLLLGALRALGLLNWRLEQLEATTPSRIGRDGLKVGKKAPDFTLPGVANGEVTLHDFAGCKVLLVFTQSGCSPCHAIMPELKRVHSNGEHQVLVVNDGDAEATRKWAGEVAADFPVLVQQQFGVAKRYQVFATPFAFLIDEKGIIISKGVCGSRQHLNYVLTGAGHRARPHVKESEPVGRKNGGSEGSLAPPEAAHVNS